MILVESQKVFKASNFFFLFFPYFPRRIIEASAKFLEKEVEPEIS